MQNESFDEIDGPLITKKYIRTSDYNFSGL